MKLSIQHFHAALSAGFLLACTVMATTPAAAGELSAEARAAIEQARAQLNADREKLLADNLDLTAEQAGRFWPLYREYAGKRAALGDQRLELIVDYAAVYPAVDDATADKLVGRALKWERSATDLRLRYARKMGKVLSGAQLMRFLQIERRIDNLIDLDLQSVVPIVDLPMQ